MKEIWTLEWKRKKCWLWAENKGNLDMSWKCKKSAGLSSWTLNLNSGFSLMPDFGFQTRQVDVHEATCWSFLLPLILSTLQRVLLTFRFRVRKRHFRQKIVLQSDRGWCMQIRYFDEPVGADACKYIVFTAPWEKGAAHASPCDFLQGHASRRMSRPLLYANKAASG